MREKEQILNEFGTLFDVVLSDMKLPLSKQSRDLKWELDFAYKKAVLEILIDLRDRYTLNSIISSVLP